MHKERELCFDSLTLAGTSSPCQGVELGGGEGEDEEGAGPVQNEVGFCPRSKDGRNNLTHLLGQRGPGHRKHCLLSAGVSFLICGKCEDFLFPPGWW